MKDILQDIVAHTHSLGFLNMIKITNDQDTIIESISEDKTVVLKAKTHKPVNEFQGIFGMPNLEKLNLHLKNPEYQENAVIKVESETRNEQTVPVKIHFENATGDFKNDYRFMNQAMVEQQVKSVKFKGATWSVEFEPNVIAINRLKLMSDVHKEEEIFSVSTRKNNQSVELVFSFGNNSNHAGEYVFHSDVQGELAHTWSWPVKQVQSILNLGGDKNVKISDQGAMMITVDSGMTLYEYILPALTN